MKYRHPLYWIGRFVITFVISFILLLLSVFSLLLLPPIQNYALARAHPLFENILIGKINIGSIQSNLISYAKLNNIKITDTITRGNDVFIDHVIVNFWLPAVLLKRITISSIKVNKITINSLRLKNRKFQFPAMPQSNPSSGKGEKTALKLHLNKIIIDTLRLTYVDKEEGININLHYAAVLFHFVRPESLYVKFTSDRVDINTRWWNGTIDTISSLCVADPNGVQIDTMHLRGPEINTMLYGYVPFSSEQKWNLFCSVIARIIYRKGDKSLLHNYIERGVLHLDIHWSGSLINPIINLKSQVDNLKIGKFPIRSILFKGIYEDTTLLLDIKITEGKTVGDIRIQSKIPKLLSNPQIGDYTLLISSESKNLESIRNLIPQLKDINVENLKLKISGKGYGINLPRKANLICSGQTRIKDVEYLSAQLELLNNYWKSSAIWAENSFSSEGTLSKGFHFKGISNIVLNEPELISRLLFKRDVEGKIESTIQFDGSLKAIDFTSQIDCDSLSWDELLCEKLTGEITFKKNQFSFGNVMGVVRGTFDSLFRVMMIDSAGGKGSIEFVASGNIPEVHATAIISSKDVFYKRFRADSIKSKISIRTLDSIFLSNFEAKNGLSKFTASGNCFMKNGLNITMQGKSERQSSEMVNSGTIQLTANVHKNFIESCVEIDSMDISAIHQWVALDQSYSGIVTSDLQISGSVQNPQVQSSFYLKNPGMDKFTLSDISGNLLVTDSMFKIEGRIPLSEYNKKISLNANIPFLPGNKFNIDTSGNRNRFINIKSDTFNLSDLEMLADKNVMISGLACFDLSMNGNKGLWNLDGNINLLNDTIRDELHDITVRDINVVVNVMGNSNNPEIMFRLKSGKTDIVTEQIAETILNGKFDRNTIIIDSGKINVQSGKALVFSGNIPIISTETDKLFISYKADNFPLKIFGAFTPEVIISDGYIEGNGTIYFNNSHLLSNGLLKIRNGAIETEFIEQKIKPLNGDILLKGDSILLNNWKGKIENGSFTISGSAFVKDRKELGIDLVMRGNNIYLEAPDLLNTQMNDFKLRIINAEKRNHYVLKGTVNFGPTTFKRDVQIQDIIAASSKKAEYQKKTLMDSLELQIVLQFQDNLYIDMNLGNMQLDGNLAVSGTVAQPAFVGKIDVVQGDILYLDRKFSINKGSVNFVNPLEFNPVLYLEAGTEVNTFAQSSNQNITYVINLKITGNLQRPVVTFSSDPPLNEPNIMSVLTLGTTLGSVGSDISSRIGSLVGNEILGFGTQRIEQLLGLESITVTGNIFNRQTEENGPLLTLTKRLTDRLSVSYETGIGTFNQQRVSILYRLFPYLFFSGQTDNTGNANVNLKFRLTR